MRPYLLAILAVVAIAVVAVGVHGCAAEANAVRVIEQNGAAVSKPIPTVTVFVPQSGGGEKSFGDQQLAAIVPVLKDVDKFTGLQLDGSSISDASMSRLTSLTQLESLDVSRTAVTAKGLLELRSLPKLKVIRTGATQLSADDRKTLAAAMPGVVIE
jgi:hypothetical protein